MLTEICFVTLCSVIRFVTIDFFSEINEHLGQLSYVEYICLLQIEVLHSIQPFDSGDINQCCIHFGSTNANISPLVSYISFVLQLSIQFG
jgi:hypothetical protein